MPDLDRWFNTADQKRFYLPSRVMAGVGMFGKALELIDHYDSVILVYDSFFENRSQLLQIKGRLGERLVGEAKVTGSPWVEDAEQLGLSKADAPPEAVLVLGGGSAADFAKAFISYMLFGRLEMGPLIDHPKPEPEFAQRRPILISITTTAGSGAEASRYIAVYSKETRSKKIARSFTFLCDWVFLDPIFLRDCPLPVLLNCAFDVCVHYLETMVCRYESSTYSRGLSTQGIIVVMRVLDRILFKGKREDGDLSDLMIYATMAGGAISNVRTGHIHEAAGALLELSTLNHGETLFVFFRTFIEDYKEHLAPLLAPALLQLSAEGVLRQGAGVTEFLDFWDRCYEESGLTARISSLLQELPVTDAAFNDHIFNRAYEDKVWMEKEGPSRLSPEDLRGLMAAAFARFGA